MVLPQIAIGVGAASFWRGCWYILDDHCYPNHPQASAAVCLGAGSLGTYVFTKHVGQPYLRLGGLAVSCVLLWRGTWIASDQVYEAVWKESATDAGHLTLSGVASVALAGLALHRYGRLANILAPPASYSILQDKHVLGNVAKKRLSRSRWNTPSSPSMARGYARLVDRRR